MQSSWHPFDRSRCVNTPEEAGRIRTFETVPNCENNAVYKRMLGHDEYHAGALLPLKTAPVDLQPVNEVADPLLAELSCLAEALRGLAD